MLSVDGIPLYGKSTNVINAIMRKDAGYGNINATNKVVPNKIKFQRYTGKLTPPIASPGGIAPPSKCVVGFFYAKKPDSFHSYYFPSRNLTAEDEKQGVSHVNFVKFLELVWSRCPSVCSSATDKTPVSMCKNAFLPPPKDHPHRDKVMHDISGRNCEFNAANTVLFSKVKKDYGSTTVFSGPFVNNI
jgi:hypothetical protein